VPDKNLYIIITNIITVITIIIFMPTEHVGMNTASNQSISGDHVVLERLRLRSRELLQECNCNLKTRQRKKVLRLCFRVSRKTR